MKLDDRINSLSDIFSCINADEARKFIGQRGYFTDYICGFSNLNGNRFGVLDDVEDVECYDLPFKIGDGHFCHWRYFIPESSLKPVEKKYRPFTDTKEFFIKTNFEVGDLIHIRSKPNNYEYHLLIIGWTDEGLMLGNFSEMTFDELFDKFELWDGEDNFIPFGVEEK